MMEKDPTRIYEEIDNLKSLKMVTNTWKNKKIITIYYPDDTVQRYELSIDRPMCIEIKDKTDSDDKEVEVVLKKHHNHIRQYSFEDTDSEEDCVKRIQRLIDDIYILNPNLHYDIRPRIMLNVEPDCITKCSDEKSEDNVMVKDEPKGFLSGWEEYYEIHDAQRQLESSFNQMYYKIKEIEEQRIKRLQEQNEALWKYVKDEGKNIKEIYERLDKLEQMGNNLDEVWKRIKLAEEGISTVQNHYFDLSDDVFDLQIYNYIHHSTVRANRMNDRIDKFEEKVEKLENQSSGDKGRSTVEKETTNKKEDDVHESKRIN